MSGLVVAIDGTSGSGKSSTARGVASRLGLAYLDTGAQFRAMTWWMLQHGVDVHDAEAVARHAAEPEIEVGLLPSSRTVRLDGVDVTAEIRSDAVNAAVSPVSVVPEVRAELLRMQRALIGMSVELGPGIVVEGRNIGSVVWPQADLKLYLTADPAARASRRAAEAGGDVAATKASLEARDVLDSGRATAPLVQADGALHLDTTNHTLDEVIDQVVTLAQGVRA